MAQYETGTASDQTDLMQKLSTFAQANGCTETYYNGTSRHLSLARVTDAVYVSFAWDNINTIAIYQALGYSGGSAEAPWDQLNDSGNGQDLATNPTWIDRGRQVSRIGTGPFTAYHFFAYTNPHNIHVVLEFSPGLFRHFGFGTIAKTGTWLGGQWCGGHLWNWLGSTPFNVYGSPYSSAHSMLLDGALFQGSSYTSTATNYSAGTLHIEGMPNQDAASKWGCGVVNSQDDGQILLDRAGNTRIRISGGCRSGVALSMYGTFLPDLANGFIPIIPMEVFYCDGDAAINGWYYLGRMHNIGLGNTSRKHRTTYCRRYTDLGSRIVFNTSKIGIAFRPEKTTSIINVSYPNRKDRLYDDVTLLIRHLLGNSNVFRRKLY